MEQDMAEAARKQVLPPMTVADFLDWEDGTETRYELLNGSPVAMAPPLLAHAAIVSALTVAIGSRLQRPCRTLTEVGVRIPDREDIFYLCDLLVACGQHDFRSRYIGDPTVLIEVLSPSTAAHDRGNKAAGYRTIPSAQEIVLVSASAIEAEVWRRTDRGWLIEDVSGPDGLLRLPSVGVEVRLGAIYEGIALEEPPGRAAEGT
jgi:Uma2 family endonuclease